METLLLITSVLQVFAISLGVGSSTLAIVNFFVAVADGEIDETERRMMGVVYVVLRIAMLFILLTTVGLVAAEYSAVDSAHLSAFSLGQLTVLFVLFLNALLMSAHLVPTTVGPALQAGSWYTLGTLIALEATHHISFTFFQFFLAYVAWIILAIGIVNSVLAILNAKRAQ